MDIAAVFKIRFRIYLFLNGGLVILVMALFSWIPDRQIASIYTGSMFVLSPLLILLNEGRIQRKNPTLPKAWMAIAGATQFLLLSALPIFYLRISNWVIAFDALTLFGVPAPLWHKLSNYSFLLMLICFMVESTRKRPSSHLSPPLRTPGG